MFLQPRVNAAHKLVEMLRQHLVLYGYQNVETSIIESADLFLTKAGDQIITRLFTFERHGRQLALRPEFTAAAAHYYAQQAYEGIVRWQFSGPVFEDDPDDYRHNYQRLSVGAELIGMAGSAADAELVSLLVDGVVLAQVADWRVMIGHVGLTRHLLGRFQLDSRIQRFLLNHLPALQNPDLGKEYVLQQLDKALLGRRPENGTVGQNDDLTTQQMLDVLLDATQRGMTMGGRTRHDIARRLLQKRQRVADRGQIIAALDFLHQWSSLALPARDAFTSLSTFIDPADAHAQVIIQAWQEMLALVDVYGVGRERITVQPALARSWEYYTGVVFELRTDSGVQLGGGGRYDELVSLIGGGSQKSVPAVGFAYYVDQLVEVLPDSPDSNHAPAVILLDGTNDLAAARWAHDLRARGVAVSLLPYEPASSAVIRVTGDTAHLDSTSYTVEQIEHLIASLDLNAHDQPRNARPAK